MMIPNRDAVNVSMIGDMKTGKTTVVKHFVNTLAKFKPILILDTGRQDDYSDIKQIKIADIKTWGEKGSAFQKKYPIVKVQIEIDPDKSRNKQTAEFDKFCVTCNTSVHNAGVIIEDALSFISTNPPSSYKSWIRNTRNNGVDLLQNFHDVNDIPKVAYGSTQVFFVKHTAITDYPKKALSAAPLVQIRQQLDRMNAEIVKRPDNPMFYHYATIEYIADPAIRLQYEALKLKLPLDNF